MIRRPPRSTLFPSTTLSRPPYEPGQMVALKLPKTAAATPAGPAVLERANLQLWALDLSTSSSSPILAGNYVYLVTEKEIGEHTSELQSPCNLVCRLLLEKKN